MACSPYQKLCPRLVLSQSVTFADDALTINIPAGSYENEQKYCIVVAQSIPTETTIAAPVVITIGDDTTTTYPLLKQNCTPVYAASINSRTRYSTIVHTGIQEGVFTLTGRLPCSQCINAPAALPLPTTTTTTGGNG